MASLKDVPAPIRRRMTRAYPVLIVSKQGGGKTYAMEQLSTEDKSRTVYINFENKNLPNDFGDEYRTIICVKPSGLIPADEQHLYKDYENVKFKTLEEMKQYCRKALAHPDVDRMVFDSTTSMHDQLERHYVTVSKGFTIWSLYGAEILAWLALIKEENNFNNKFVYVFGHNVPAKNSKNIEDSDPYIQIKGSQFPRGAYESNFNTVISVENHAFIADNDDTYSPTRIHKSLSPYASNENSLSELEEDLSKLFLEPQASQDNIK